MAEVMTRRRSGSALSITVGVALLVITAVAAVSVGTAQLDFASVWSVLLSRLGIGTSELGGTQAAIVWELRLPRVIGAMVVGAGLALCGAVMQTLMRNPLADPYLLGLSSGAGVGAVVVIVLGVGGGPLVLSLGAFGGALVALLVVLMLAGARGGRLTPTRTILAGVAFAAFASAISALLLVTAAGDAAKRVMLWTFGSLGGLRWDSLGVACVVLAAVTVLVLLHGRTLNSLTFGDRLAGSLGVEVARARWVLLVATAVLTAVLVAICGAIGFVGLVVPHAVAFVTPYDHRLRIPITMIAGALFLTWVDVIARVAFAPREMPIGVMTAIIGVPLFIWLLHRNRRI
ncbi:iron chelate uptake ABC transporter family permease subunit [Epidermidibacterium keratini]